MTRNDEPRLCVHCGSRIARNAYGVWGLLGWGASSCPSWEPGRLREPVDTEYAGLHFPGILIVDTEVADA